MSNITNNVPVSIIAEAQVWSASTEEKSRREGAIANKDFYYSNQEKYLNKVNLDVDEVTVNLTGPIIKKKVSLLYGRPLIRDFVGTQASVAAIEAVYANMDIDHFLRSVDLASELTGTGVVHVGISNDLQVTLTLYDGSEISVISNRGNDSQELEAISLVSIVSDIVGTSNDPQLKRVLKTETWTNDFITVNMDGAKDISIPNDLEFLPFVAFKGEDVYNQYLGHAPATQIRKLNNYINHQLTNLGYMIKMQSATPVILEGFQNGEGIVIHPGKAIAAPAGSSVTALNLNPKINDTLIEIQYLEEKLYESANIPKVTVIGDAESQSGRELMIKWAPIMDVYKDKALRFETYELKLANMILSVLSLDPLDSLNVHYAEEAVLPLSNDIDELEREISLGLSTPVDGMLVKQPELNELDAEALVRANMDFNDALFGSDDPEETDVPDNIDNMEDGKDEEDDKGKDDKEDDVIEDEEDDDKKKDKSNKKKSKKQDNK